MTSCEFACIKSINVLRGEPIQQKKNILKYSKWYFFYITLCTIKTEWELNNLKKNAQKFPFKSSISISLKHNEKHQLRL